MLFFTFVPAFTSDRLGIGVTWSPRAFVYVIAHQCPDLERAKGRVKNTEAEVPMTIPPTMTHEVINAHFLLKTTWYIFHQCHRIIVTNARVTAVENWTRSTWTGIFGNVIGGGGGRGMLNL